MFHCITFSESLFTSLFGVVWDTYCWSRLTAGLEGLCKGAGGQSLYNHWSTSLLKRSPMLSLVPYDGLFLKEHRALFDEGRIVAFAVHAEGSSCVLRLISMLLPAKTTYSIGPSTLFFAISKFRAFEAAQQSMFTLHMLCG